MAKRKSTKKSTGRGSDIVAKISRKAKQIRKPGESWNSAIKRASKMI